MYQYGNWTQMQRQQQSLPSGWEVKWDPNSGRWFYINHATKKTQWDPPTQSQGAAPQMTTTSFIQADPDKVKLLTEEYANLTSEYAGSALRIHRNNLAAARSAIDDRGYAKKKPDVEPKAHFVSSLKKSYPSAPEDIIKEVLVSTSNNFLGARAGLESMGFKRTFEKGATQLKAKPAPSSSSTKVAANSKAQRPATSPAKPKGLTESEKQTKILELKKKYPNINESLIKLSLTGTNYDVNMASSVLQASVDSVNSSLRTGVPNTTASPKTKVEPVAPVNYAPVIFGADEERREQTSTAMTSLDDLISGMKTSVSDLDNLLSRKSQTTQPATEQRYSAVRKREALKPKIIPIKKQPVAGGYTSALRIQPMGPDPTLCNGPNPSLLLDRRIQAVGPNRALRQGPQRTNRCGPLRSNARGSAHIAVGPQGAVGPAVLVV